MHSNFYTSRSNDVSASPLDILSTTDSQVCTEFLKVTLDIALCRMLAATYQLRHLIGLKWMSETNPI